MRKKIIVLSILALVIGGLLTGGDGSPSAQSETNPPDANNEAGENNHAPKLSATMIWRVYAESTLM